MDVKAYKETVVTHVYHLKPETKVPLHQHADKDEVFYCIKGEGFGVLADSEVELSVGKAFIVPAGTLHSLRTETELFVTATLAPVVE
jgi:mannose-6-phosphate isomerase-like protein (cupin superfamily)